MTTDTDSITTDAMIRSIDIISGRARGARFVVSAGDRVLVGDNMQADIVLHDKSVAGCTVALSSNQGELSVEALQGDILLDDALLELGASVMLNGQVLQMGDVQLMAEQISPDSFSTSEEAGNSTRQLHLKNDEPVSVNEAFDALAVQTDDNNESMSLPVSQTNTGALWRPIIGCVLFLLAGLGGWALSSQSIAPQTDVSVESLLAGTEFDTLQIEQVSGTIVVSGMVANRHKARELKTLLATLPDKIDDRTQLLDAQLAHVVDVFRVNGESVSARLNEQGDVVVQSAMVDDKRVRYMREIVSRDVPNVQGLIIENSPPTPEPSKKPVVEPGKRVAIVISDDPAYVVTEDESRYFIGAVLPSGHRIISIEDGRVALEMQGKVTELEF